MAKLSISIASLAALAALNLPHAGAAPCILETGESSATCSGQAQQKIIKIAPRAEGVSVISPFASDYTPAINILTPNPQDSATTPSECRTKIRRVRDFDSALQTPRYEVCLDDLRSDEGLEIEAAYKRLRRAASRTCRINSYTAFQAFKYCRRDTLYRAILDTQTPALTAYYAAKTKQFVPRVEIDPAKTY